MQEEIALNSFLLKAYSISRYTFSGTQVESEIGSTGFTPRHRINQASPSFPYNHRTMANRDSLGTGPKDQINVGKHKFYGNLSILAMLCEDLSK